MVTMVGSVVVIRLLLMVQLLLAMAAAGEALDTA